MAFLKNVTARNRQPEIIDQPDLDPQRLQGALQGLERINWWSGSARILWPPIRAFARKSGSKRLRILDIATGAGDVPIRLAQKAQHAGLDLQFEGCDFSANALGYARGRAAARGAEVRFFEWDALRGDFPSGYDVLTCSLFLHHLDQEQAVTFLRRASEAAQRLVLVNDLVRSWAGFTLAYLGTRILTRSPVVHTDGPRSVEGAFTLQEARSLAERAGLHGATVERRWPCRYLLAWAHA